ncbi:phosphoribosylformylglycinamidine synthase [candidate division WOR_3 bacterium SM23_60]|uniref:Phosphoribosylformylglycinamidine synthase subunit PurQ n=1 Tax=candidate division WOR_3 bacterium SM23_60 TaxID=1703780 RepID=A0A0S8G439_UNCW3|nr:MAG: phosphoribosylformylglycinamidine synthase [candidate division WOR_3 bacterium SM23_60]
MKPKVLVVRAAGTNCDIETAYAFTVAGGEAERVYIDAIKNTDVAQYQIIAVPGGFTYGDDIAAGKILANEIKYMLRDTFTDFIQRDKLIIGICNGFQVLVKAGILPAFEGYFEEQSVSLVANDSERFEDRWVYLKVNSGRSVFTKNSKPFITLPVAHAEGRFVVKDEDVGKKIERHIVFQYVDKQGNEAGYPCNPNGSFMNIAGITDPSGRVLGLMPHPERHISYLQHPHHTRDKVDEPGDGFHIFKNAVNYFKL